jgi:hypothetical protein
MAAQTITRRAARAPDLKQAEAAMQRAWYDLALAEQRGQSAHVLERKFAAYMAALDAFVAAQRGA